jgi:hypothetical protein
MDAKTIFTKTAKGVTQVNQKTQSLSRQHSKILKAIDGKSTIDSLSDKLDIAIPILEKELGLLKKEGFIKVFEVRVETPISEFGGDDDDFDFTAPTKMAAALKEPVAAFGPSKYRTGLNDQVESAAAKPEVDEAAQIAAQIEARKKEEAKLEDARIASEALEAAKHAAQKAQAEARARAEREAEIRARLEVEARARKEAETRAIEETKRAEIAAANSRAALEAKLAEEALKRSELIATRERMTQEQQAKEAIAQRELAEARARAEAEAKALAQARANMEAEMKALAQARAQAEAASVRQTEELASAQRALRTQLKAEIEAKVRGEMEALLKSDIEDSARAEVEAAVRAEALDDARRQLEEQLTAERSSLAKIEAAATERAEIAAKKMLAEQETKMRAEMQVQLAELAAEKTRVEIEARKMAEAQAEAAARASAEFAARLKSEEDARHVLEVEAQARRLQDEEDKKRLETRALEEASARAEAEAARALADAEAKAIAQAAAAETQALTAKLKAEEETRQKIEADAAERRQADALTRTRLEKRAVEEAESRQKSEAEMQAKLSAEKQARIEAQAKALLEADMREKEQRQSSAELDEALRARAEAEEKARLETKAREIASNAVAQQVAEKEKLAELADERLATEREAREKAEAKAYADERAEASQRQAQVARLKELADIAERTKSEPVEMVDGKRRRPKPKREIHVGRWIAFGVVLLIIGAVGALHLIPLGAANQRMEKALSEWMHDDVSSAGLRVALFPKPHVKIEQLALGKLLDAKAGSGKLYMDVMAVFGDKFVIDTMELSDITISAEALPRALKWANSENRGKTIEIDKIILRNIKMDVPGIAMDVFDGELQFDRKGAITRASARTRDGKWTLDISPDKVTPPVEGQAPPWTVDFSARNWTPPIGIGVQLNAFTAKGSWIGDDIIFSGIDAKLLEGAGKGNLKINLSKGINVQSDFTLERIKADELMGVFTRDISITGRTEAAFTVAASGNNMVSLLANPTITGNFAIREGTLSNVDLVQAMRNPGSVGGQTKFAEFSGKVRISDGMVRYESMRMAGGVLFANGNVSVSYGKGVVSGGVNSEIRSNVAQDRAVFTLSGTVARPALKRG